MPAAEVPVAVQGDGDEERRCGTRRAWCEGRTTAPEPGRKEAGEFTPHPALPDRPAWKSRTSPKPSCPDRAGGSARCKTGSPDRRVSPLSYKSDTSYRNVNERRELEFGSCFGGSEQRSHNIVIMRFGNAQTAHLALARRRTFEIVDQSHSIDLRRLCGHACLPKQIRFKRWALYQHVNLFAHQGPITGTRDLPLDRHQPPLAVLHGAAVHFAIEPAARAGVLVGIREHAQVVEFCGFDKPAQFVEIRGCFAGKSDNETGANGDRK